MTLQDELTSAERCLEDLTRCVGRLEQEVGSGLDIRRLRSDTEHLRESLALLKASAPESPSNQPTQRSQMVTITDTPYDTSLWAGAEDEGLGAHDRRAP